MLLRSASLLSASSIILGSNPFVETLKDIIQENSLFVNRIFLGVGQEVVGLQYILDRRIKRMKDKGSSVIVELPHTNCTRGGHILHEQEYNTRHGIPAIPDEVCGETRRQAGQPEV